MFIIRILIIVICFIVYARPTVTAFGQVPLRQTLSLNEAWQFTPLGGTKTTIPVPEAWDASPGFAGVNQATYEKSVVIPSTWQDKRITLEFQGVNHIADVYINGNHVKNHIGGWIPFTVDITAHTNFGTENFIKVEVKGGSHPPIVDGNGKPQWPVGWYSHTRQWGIVHDVYLHAHPQVYVKDAFIKPSTRNQQLVVDYTIVNSTNQPQSLSIRQELVREEHLEKTFIWPSTTIQPNSTQIITVTQSWTNPTLWDPHQPELYYLHTSLLQGNAPIDLHKQRFGFREIWIEGNTFKLNGTRLNLWGDSMEVHSQRFNSLRYTFVTKDTWATTVETMRDLNIRVLRFHQQPAPPFALDIADELGLLVIDESPIYARDYLPLSPKASYIANAKTWIVPWIESRRNHPSVVYWSVENELGQGWLNWLSDAELRSLGEVVKTHDPTRPVGYDGDKNLGTEMINHHYPEGYGNTWNGSIYQHNWANSSSKPVGMGEYLADYYANGPANKWWQALTIRGFRYLNFSDIRPYNLLWAWKGDDPLPARVALLKNSMAEVALFDKAYDDSGINIYTNNAYPSLDAGATVERTLVLYNDQFKNTEVVIDISLYLDETKYASGSAVGTLTLGNHVDIPIHFQVPNRGGEQLQLVLQTRKNSELTFSETRIFSIRDTGASGTTNPIVTIDWGSPYTLSRPGDINLDGAVDGLDYGIFFLQWDKPVPPGDPRCDFNQDGVVNSLDYLTLFQNWDPL